MTMIQPHQANCCHNPAGVTPTVKPEQEAIDSRVLEHVQCMSRDEIEQFQFRHGLPQTGEADMSTMKAIASELAADQTQCSEADAAAQISKDELYRNNPTTMRGQRALNAFFKDPNLLAVDGIRGPNTTACIESFQELSGLEVTGKFDAATRKALFGAQTDASSRCDDEPARQKVQVKVSRIPREEFDRQHGNLNPSKPVPIPSHWTDFFDTSHDGLLQHLTNFGAGVGDAASFGATNVLRKMVGGNESVDKESWMYAGGSVIGEIPKNVLVGHVATASKVSAATAAVVTVVK